MKRFLYLVLAFPLLAASPNRPDPTLTPGHVLNVTEDQVCVSGYAKRTRDVDRQKKQEVYDRYGVEWVKGKHEIEHLIPLCMGGSNELENLWPAPKATARRKAKVDGHLCREVCAGNLTIEEAREKVRQWENVTVQRHPH